jgi:hypothetical protein
MLKGIIESRTNLPLSSEDFKEILKMTQDDIQANRINFKKKTRIDAFTEIAVSCANTYAGATN